VEAMLEVFEGDRDLIREVVELFLQQYPGQIAALREAMERGQAQIVERAAHSLKGSVSNFAFPAAFYSLQKLEMLAKKGNLAEGAVVLALVEEQMQALQAALASFQKVRVA
jgi:HPt (histidine-containing phosphotransfer) domain-containing protein